MLTDFSSLLCIWNVFQQMQFQCLLCGMTGGKMAVWRHVATNHLNPYYVPFICQCGVAYKSLAQASKHMVARGCAESTVSPGYDRKVFRIIMTKKESVPGLLEPITDDELDYAGLVHMPDYSWRSGLMPNLNNLEDVSDVPLEEYLSSDSESSSVSSRSSCSSSSETEIYASDMDLSLEDSDDDMFDIDGQSS